MKTSARVVVIGGGVTGCSILYHLARKGWSDVVLLERKELTSGSSWHAAGNLFTLTSPANATALQKYTIELYPTLERESGQSCGYHPVGGLELACSEEQYLTLKVERSRGRRHGIDALLLSPREAQQLAPILDIRGVVAALLDPLGGFCDPASVTQAYAKAARRLGATVYRHTPVMELRAQANGEWDVVTPSGSLRCEFVVNAAGLWAREVAALAGIALPLLPVQHQYLVTETIGDVSTLGSELPTISDAEAGFYSRREGRGMLLGAYEKTCHHWAVEGTPLDFDHELLPDDVGRMENELAQAAKRMPCLQTAGIKSVINGPMVFSPDLGPLLGPYPGLRNYFCACGVMTGFNQSGGIGDVLADWIMEGEPGLDVSFWDVARFGDYALGAYTEARTRYFYEHRQQRVYPQQEFTAGRPLRTVPVHPRLQRAGAVFGESFGWEYPLWYATDGRKAVDRPSYGRGNWFEAVGEECRAVHRSVGLFETSTFGKYEVSGRNAGSWLEGLLANRMPQALGKTVLSPMLSPKGRLIGDFTVTRIAEQRFLLLASGTMQRYHLRWFTQHLPSDDSVSVVNLSDAYSGLHIAGPNARMLLSRSLDTGTDDADFPFLSGRTLRIGACREAFAIRISFTGELGYEIYCPAEHQESVFDALDNAAHGLDLKLAGMRALMSMRLEKSFPSWGLELSADYSPYEAGLSRLVKLDKGSFIGLEAASDPALQTPRETIATFVIDAGQADASGGEPILLDDEVVGYVTSGGYGYRLGESLALGYLQREHHRPGAEFAIEIVGNRRPARLVGNSPFDPDGKRMRR